MIAGELRYEPLQERHLPLRRSFRCGEEALDVYLRSKQAWRDQEHGLAAVRILYDPARNRIAGYYTLSAFAIEQALLPEEVTRGRTNYEAYPAILIGRLARDQAYAGQKIGPRLLLDALKRALDASQQVAGCAVVVDALTENAARFYARYGFRVLEGDPSHEHRCYVSMETVRQLFSSLDE